MKICSVEGCSKKSRSRTFCSMHYRRWYFHGDPSVTRKRGHQPGDRHPNWKGDDIGYATAHDRVYTLKGKASDYECSCGKPAQEWAYDHQDPNEKVSGRWAMSYSTNPDHYFPKCTRCHADLDVLVRSLSCS